MSIKLLATISELNIFFLNLAYSKTFANNQKAILAYMRELCEFSQWYCKQRYGLDIRTEPYYPYFVPKTYADVQKYDATDWRNVYFGPQIQMYCGYGLNLKPHELDTDGFCECMAGSFSGDKELKISDMLYVDMPEYSPNSFFGGSIYKQMAYFSKAFFHEVDHQVLKLANYATWSSAVHRAAGLPFETWAKIGKGAYMQRTLPLADYEIYFTVQQNPLLV